MLSKKIKKINIFGNIPTMLLAAIISMNALRFIFGFYESGIIVYSIYFAFCSFSLLQYGIHKESINQKVNVTTLICIVMLIYALTTSVLIGSEAEIEALKLAVLFVMIICIYLMPIEKINQSIDYVLILNLVYSLIIVTNLKSVDAYMTKGGNYLTLTLPLALSLTIVLTKFVCNLCFGGAGKKKLILNLLFSGIYFLAIMKFSARSSFLFPFICVMVISLVVSKGNKLKLIKIYLVLALVIYIGYRFFMQNADSYTMSRMMQLFQDFESEDRFAIWKNCIEIMINKGWFIIGGGINAFVDETGFYPHNFYLQYIGEMGIVGMIFCVNITYTSCWFFFKRLREIFEDKVGILDFTVFFEIVASLFFLFLTFMKSFSIYDGIVLYIFIAMLYKSASCNISDYTETCIQLDIETKKRKQFVA